jgi:hypothetical protein
MRGIPKKDILSRTDIRIIDNPAPAGENKEYLQDKYGNILHINPQTIIDEDNQRYVDNENIREVERYGSNNATYIIDTLVKEFKTVYIDDNGLQNLFHDTNTIFEDIVKDMDRTHGYEVVDVVKGVINIPIREEKDYLKE